MASPDIIDLTKLLAPISEESPTGNDVRLDPSPSSKYQMIKSARAAARAAERKSIHDGDSTESEEHWRKILTLAPEILSSQSKDLEIASWFTEALIRKHGFQGLRDAFKLIHGLVENFWDQLYPMPDEDGMETRTSSFSGLNGEGAEGVLLAPIRKVPLTEGHYPGPFGFWQYQQALEAQRPTDEGVRASKIEKLGFSLADIEKAVSESSNDFFINQFDDISEAISTFKDLGLLLDQKCGLDDAPSTRNILDALEDCRGAISHIGKDKLPSPAIDEPVDAIPGLTEQPASGAAPTATTGIINSREVAFKQLLEISKFFRKTEPHSPVSYVLEKAVKWGNMPLNELIAELITEPSSLKRYSELTGVESESEDN